MMKTDAITKINKIGKIGNVLTIIARIFAITALIISIAGTIFVAIIPDDLVKVNVKGDATVDVDISSFGVTLSEKEQTDLKSDLESGSISVTTGPATSKLETNSAVVNANGFSLRADGDMMNFSLHNIFLPLLASCIYLIMTIVTLFFISALCKAFSTCQSPFEENVIIKMKRLAFSLIPWVILSSITNGLMEGFMTGQFNFNAGINLEMILVILLIFVLTYIFQYGAVLQQESDETL